MNYFLVKSDPETYSWNDLLKDGTTSWDGVRNYAARNFMRTMKKGDAVLVYHSGGESAVVGIAEVTKAAYQDPTTEEVAWVSVELKAVKTLPKAVTLKSIKADKRMATIPLVTIGRLSVMPLKAEDYDAILELSR